MVIDVRRFFLTCYKRIYKGYFGYRHSEKTRQNIEIGKLVLEDLGILEKISESLEEIDKRDNS